MAKVDSDAEMNDMLWRVKKGELSSESEDDSALDQSFDSDAPAKKRDAKKKSKKEIKIFLNLINQKAPYIQHYSYQQLIQA